MTYLFHTHIFSHGRGDNREKNIMMLYFISLSLPDACSLIEKALIAKVYLNPSIPRFLQISLITTDNTTEYYPSTIRPPAPTPAPARPPPTHKHKPKPIS